MIDVVVFQNISILKKMWMLYLGISGFCLGTKRMKTLLLEEEKDILDSSDALSDQVRA